MTSASNLYINTETTLNQKNCVQCHIIIVDLKTKANKAGFPCIKYNIGINWKRKDTE